MNFVRPTPNVDAETNAFRRVATQPWLPSSETPDSQRPPPTTVPSSHRARGDNSEPAPVPQAPDVLHSLIIVDDDPDMLELWRMGFETYGLDVYAYTSAEEAMTAPELWDVDLVVTDLELTRNSGVDLIARVRQERPGLPFLGVTGSRDRELIAAALAAGAHACILTPSSPVQILERATRGAATQVSSGRLGSRVEGTPYLLDGVLGEGGHGIVYSGINLDLGRRVAVKMSKQDASDEVTQHLLHEARVLEALRGKSIPEVLGFRELEDGRAMLVMELLEGELLSSRLERGALPLVSVLQFLDGLLGGLTRAHNADIVHLDLKPDNLMFVARPEGEELKILDFGLAGVAGHTARGFTPGWSAPEQEARGSLDKRTDVFACGLICESLLTGQAPRARFSPAWLPDELTLSQLEAFGWWIQKCRHTDANKRFADAASAHSGLVGALAYFGSGSSEVSAT